MTENEAYEAYPDEYILFKSDEPRNISNHMGTVLYIGDDYYELFSLGGKRDDRAALVVLEGLYFHRSLGGLVVGE